MRDFEKYQAKAKAIAAQAVTQGDTLGWFVPWVMIIVGVVVTGIQTHALSVRGMRGSELYAAWLDVASWLPVVLLEGTAVGLTLGRLRFFKGTEQRRLGHGASFAVWAALAFNTIVQFAWTAGELPAPLLFYVRYVLPLSIVAVPYLWKWLLDLHPESQERIATLEVEARYAEQWRKIQEQQNNQLIAAYGEAVESPEVRQAVTRLVAKAALKRATQIVGAIGETETELRREYRDAAGSAPTVSTEMVNGKTEWSQTPKDTRH
jgi:hypothetical protein